MIFGRVRTCHKSDIEGRKPDSKIAWSSDPYGFPYLVGWQGGATAIKRGFSVTLKELDVANRTSLGNDYGIKDVALLSQQ